MTKSIIQALLLFGMLFTFSCCSQPKEPNDNLNLTIAWKEDIYTWGHTIDYENKIMFCEITTDSGNDYTNDIRQIAAFDLENLDFLWKTEDTGFNAVPPVFDDSNVYIMNGYYGTRKISVIDRKNGKIKKQTDVPDECPRMPLWTLYDNTLYWGDWDSHFMRAYSTSREDGVRTIWGSEDVTSDIMGDIVPYNNRLYFVSSVYPYTDEPEPSYLISMKPDGSDIKKLKLPADFLHTPENRTHFYEGKLYLNGMYFICVNPETMKIEWELKNSDGFFTAPGGFVIDNDRIYAPDNGGDEDDAFFCINAKNGKVIWKEKINTSFYGAILCAPVVYKEYVYLPTQGCVIVLNAKDGKYIGRDERIGTGTLSHSIIKQYEDLMIFSGTCGKTHIIKMDMHTR